MNEEDVIELGKQCERAVQQKEKVKSELHTWSMRGVIDRGVVRKQLEKDLFGYTVECESLAQRLSEALMTLFRENDKYKCPYCGGVMGVCSEIRKAYDRYNQEYDEENYGFECTSCHHRAFPCLEDSLSALIDWYKICQDEFERNYVLERWREEDLENENVR